MMTKEQDQENHQFAEQPERKPEVLSVKEVVENVFSRLDSRYNRMYVNFLDGMDVFDQIESAYSDNPEQIATAKKDVFLFLRERLQTVPDEEKTQYYEAVRRMFFGSSPHLLSEIPLLEQLLMQGELSFDTNERESFAGVFAGELNYQLTLLSQEQANVLAENIRSMPAPDQLSVLHSFETIALHSRANSFSENVLEILLSIVEHVKEHADSYFVKQVAGSIGNIFRQELLHAGEAIGLVRGNDERGKESFARKKENEEMGSLMKTDLDDLPLSSASDTISVIAEGVYGVKEDEVYTTSLLVKVGDRLVEKDIDELLNDPTIYPYGSNNGKEVKKLFQILHDPYLRYTIQEDLGLSYSDLSIREEMTLLQFLLEKDEPTVTAWKEAYKKEGLNQQAMRQAFFASVDKKLGYALIEFINDNDVSVVNPVLEAYAGLIDELQTIEQDAHQLFVSDKDIDTRELVQQYVGRANRILKHQVTRPDVDQEQIKEELAAVSADALVFASAFKTASKMEGGVSFEEIKETALVTRGVVSLTPDEKAQMLEITKRNWESQNKNVAKEVYDDFAAVLADESDTSEFHVLRREDNVIAFLRYKQISETVFGKPIVYAGSFNVDPQYRGSAIGHETMRASLIKKVEEAVLDATVHPALSVGTVYVEQIGFVIDGVIENYHKTGEPFFHITADKDRNETLASRSLTLEQILALPEEDDQLFARSLDVTDQKKNMQTIKPLLDQGFVIARYLQHPTNKQERIYVFERVAPESE